MNLVKTTFNSDDVKILLKDLTDVMTPMSALEREKCIQHGKHYCEMLPQEELPPAEYLELYNKAMTLHTLDIARYTQAVGKQILEATQWHKPVLISLARAGIPFGILLKRYFQTKHNMNCEHYAISIIREKGIDINAMDFIYSIIGSHNVYNIVFVDGWTGKGVIKRQLVEAVSKLRETSKWQGLLPRLAVVSDPADVADFYGTKEDILLPAACMNSLTSGLISRTILNNNIDITKGDFHGAVYFKEFEPYDLSNSFVDTISAAFNSIEEKALDSSAVMTYISQKYNISDINMIKPGIGETTRVLLRRIPWKVLISTTVNASDPDIAHIINLCNIKKIPCVREDLGNYKVCGLIKSLADV